MKVVFNEKVKQLIPVQYMQAGQFGIIRKCPYSCYIGELVYLTGDGVLSPIGHIENKKIDLSCWFLKGSNAEAKIEVEIVDVIITVKEIQ